VAGEGLAEPSLALPQRPSELGDAPLTASEVTRLPTGVVLSACLISWDNQPLNRRTTMTIISIVPSPPP